jgi:hypothetical protein
VFILIQSTNPRPSKPETNHVISHHQPSIQSINLGGISLLPCPCPFVFFSLCCFIVVYVDVVESLEFVRANLAMKNSISRRTMSGNLDAFPSVAQSQSVLVDWMLLFRLCWVGKELFCSASSRERPARLVGSVGIDMVMIGAERRGWLARGRSSEIGMLTYLYTGLDGGILGWRWRDQGSTHWREMKLETQEQETTLTLRNLSNTYISGLHSQPPSPVNHLT